MFLFFLFPLRREGYPVLSLVQAGSMSQPKATDYCGEKTVAARLRRRFFHVTQQLRYCEGTAGAIGIMACQRRAHGSYELSFP